jgi:alpha,alpha-trehalose phosphorylase (configuration-retaining)
VLTEKNTVAVAIAIRDTVYLHDFSVNHLELGDGVSQNVSTSHNVITEHIIHELFSYERQDYCKFIGAGIPLHLMEMAPTLCSQLWAKLDIIPITLRSHGDATGLDIEHQSFWNAKDIDEQADSMARKAIM